MKTIALSLSFLTLLAAGCAGALPIQPVRIQGTAMLPTLQDGDRAIFNRHFDKPARGDIIVFYFPDDPRVSYIKRVIGLPGEEIETREGKVLIDGNVLDEPYLDPRLNVARRASAPVTVPADSYFVMGDNRDNSSDSRIWGTVQRKLIYGTFVKKY